MISQSVAKVHLLCALFYPSCFIPYFLIFPHDINLHRDKHSNQPSPRTMLLSALRQGIANYNGWEKTASQFQNWSQKAHYSAQIVRYTIITCLKYITTLVLNISWIIFHTMKTFHWNSEQWWASQQAQNLSHVDALQGQALVKSPRTQLQHSAPHWPTPPLGYLFGTQRLEALQRLSSTVCYYI